MVKIAVIGGGISGLVCAHRLRKRLPTADIRLFEATDRTGGAIATHRQDGWVCEGGPAAFLNRNGVAVDLAASLGLESELVTACEHMRRRYILVDGRLCLFPDSMAALLSSDLLSWTGTARALLETLLPPSPRREDESVGAFARRRLGREAAERMLDPVVAGIYAGDPESLSLNAALPQLAAAERKGLSILRLLVSRREPPQEPGGSPAGIGRKRLVSFRRGMVRLVEALNDDLGSSVELRSPIRGLTRQGRRWRLDVGGERPREVLVDAVVLAMPGSAAARLLGELPPKLQETLQSIPTAPVSVVALGFRESDIPHPMEGFGYLVPSGAQEQVLGVMWSSSMFPGLRSPPGSALLRVLLGGSRHPAICEGSDEDLVLRARVHLQAVMGISARPIQQHCFRHRLGISQYQVGHGERVQRAEAALLDLPGLALAGQAYRGVGVGACVADGQRAGDAMADYAELLPPRPKNRFSDRPRPGRSAPRP